MNAAICSFPGCKFISQHNGYCIGHAKIMGTGHSVKERKPLAKSQKPIKKRGDKMQKAMKELGKLVSKLLAKPENKKCKIKSPVCTEVATCMNHKKRRGKNLLNEKYLEPSCNECNTYIEQNHLWAVEHGHLIPQHIKE